MRPMLGAAAVLEAKLEKVLSPKELNQLRYWRRRSRSRRSMLPHSYRIGEIAISDSDYRLNNAAFGHWVSDYTGNEVDLIGNSGTVTPGEYCVQYAIGDRALGLEYLKKVVFWKFKPLLLDWLASAVRLGRRKVAKILDINPQFAILDQIVKLAEVKRALITEPVVESPNLIRISQTARLIEHHEEEDAATICYGLGIPLNNPRNIAIIIGAMKGRKNSSVKKETSHNFSVPFHIHHMERGAGRPLRVVRQDSFDDLANHFKALTIQAR